VIICLSRVLLHFGHRCLVFSYSEIVNTKVNFFWHFSHRKSYVGMSSLLLKAMSEDKWFLGGLRKINDLGRASLIEPITGCPHQLGDRSRCLHDTGCLTYRCFLPDLTGFISACHARSTSSSKVIKKQTASDSHEGLSTPHKRISGYRAPLAPHLARPRPKVKSYRSTLSLSSFPTLKNGSFFEATLITSPVLGFLP